MGVLYNKMEHMFLQNLVECSTNKHQTNPNDTQGKNPYKSNKNYIYTLKNSKKSYYRNQYRKPLYK